MQVLWCKHRIVYLTPTSNTLLTGLWSLIFNAGWERYTICFIPEPFHKIRSHQAGIRLFSLEYQHSKYIITCTDWFIEKNAFCSLGLYWLIYWKKCFLFTWFVLIGLLRKNAFCSLGLYWLIHLEKCFLFTWFVLIDLLKKMLSVHLVCTDWFI